MPFFQEKRSDGTLSRSEGGKHSQGQSVEDIAQIVSLSTSSGEGRAKLEADIHRYMSKLRKPCPTPACTHGLTKGAGLCRGYETRANIIGGQTSNFEEETRAAKSNPLVIPIFCYVFSEMADQGCREKEICKKCREESFSYKSKFDGLFCHGCGFFVDYENRTVGYSDEWTTASGLMTRLDISCSYCVRKGVSTKFGDYWFCTPYCMQGWYLSGGSRRAKEKEGGGKASFLR